MLDNKLIPHDPRVPLKAHPRQIEFLTHEGIECFYGGAGGGGKAQALVTPCNSAKMGYNPEDPSQMREFRMRFGQHVLTPFGPKLIDDIQLDDAVVNPDGTTCRVIAVHPTTTQTCYRITFIDGASCIAGADHLWSVKVSGKRTRRKLSDPYAGVGETPADLFNVELMRRYKTVTTADLADWHERAAQAAPGQSRWLSVPLTEPVNFQQPPGRTRMMPPYTLGVLLGDGSLGGTPAWTKPDSFLAEEVSRDLLENGITDTVNCLARPGAYSIVGGAVRDSIRSLGLTGKRSWEKFIPPQYLNGPIPLRRALLQGLMDTDGTSDERGQCYFTTTSEQMGIDVQYVARSLGYAATLFAKPEPIYTHDGVTKTGRPAWSIYLTGRNRSDLFRLPRKRDRVTELNNMGGRRIISVERLPHDLETRCISVSHPNGLYLTNDFIVTHNSWSLLAAALQFAFIPNYSALILRRSFAELSKENGLIPKSQEWLSSHARWYPQLRQWKIPCPGGGLSTLAFGYLDHENSHLQYRSAEYQYIAFDELTSHREFHYTFMFSRLRRLKGVRIPLRMRSGSNPGGPGHEFVKHRFIDEPGQPRFVPALIDDNPSLDRDEYRLSLSHLDPVTRAQMEAGDWTAYQGGRFFRDWFRLYIDLGDAYRVFGPDGSYSLIHKSTLWYFQTIDPAASESADADYTVISTWAVTQKFQLIWVDCQRFRAEIPDIPPRALAAFRAYPQVRLVGIEAVAANNAVLKLCQRLPMPATILSPLGLDKLVRATSFMALAKEGRVFVPETAPWVETALSELTHFTGIEGQDAHDDIVDTCSYAALVLTDHGRPAGKPLAGRPRQN